VNLKGRKLLGPEWRDILQDRRRRAERQEAERAAEAKLNITLPQLKHMDPEHIAAFDARMSERRR
jgi:hypothetical protein